MGYINKDSADAESVNKKSANEKSVNHQICSVELEAPDECISELLSIRRAESMELYEGELYTFPERQGCWYLFALSDGNVQMTHNGGHINLRSGNTIALSGSENTAILPSQGGYLRMVCIQGRAADSLLLESKRQGGLFFPMGEPAVAALFNMLRTEEAHRGSVSFLQASAAAYQMLTGLYGTGIPIGNSRKQMASISADAMRIMQQEFAFLNGVGEVADRLKVSQEYLTRVFRRNVGLPPGKYLNLLKIEYAKLLLRQGGHTVAFVADACGFANGNYFARAFRQTVGMCPVEYMRSHMEQSAAEDPMLDPFYVL